MAIPNWFIYLFVNGHLHSIQCLVMTNKTPMNICEQIFAWKFAFVSLGLIPRMENLGHMVGVSVFLIIPMLGM